MLNNRYIAYYRVSTDQQGRSGLGLEAQEAAVKKYVESQSGQILAEFRETESGRRKDRPELLQAIELARLYDATLVIAKLDRLTRNAAFLLNLRDSGVKFIACDMPHANNLTVGIMALVAEEEAKMISERTKAALQAAKARGVVLGGNRGYVITPEAAKKGSEARRENAKQRAQDFRAEIDRLIGQGHATLAQLAEQLNTRSIPTPSRRGTWQPTMVSRVLNRTNDL